MYKGKKVSLVFPAFNEEENIGNAIDEFNALKLIDEIIVVDNNSIDKTAEIALEKGATVIKETKQGYGYAIRKGLSQTKGDYIILSEPDGTFSAKDTKRLLFYMQNYAMVTGTRTKKDFIKKGANMGCFLRSGNIIVAKFIQFLFCTNSISDCGCTFRILKKDLLKKIIPYFSVGGSHFLPEITILTALSKEKFFEIPVNYKKRQGVSKITGSLKGSLKVGLSMIALIIRYRAKGYLRKFN